MDGWLIIFNPIATFLRRDTIQDFQVSWAECVTLVCSLLFFALLCGLFCRSEETPYACGTHSSHSWRTTCLWGRSFSSATWRLAATYVLVELGSPGLAMAWVLPLAGVFFCIGASGLVCTGRLLQNMLGLGCEFKGKELFCTRFLPATLFFCRRTGRYYYCAARQTWLTRFTTLRNQRQSWTLCSMLALGCWCWWQWTWSGEGEGQQGAGWCILRKRGSSSEQSINWDFLVSSGEASMNRESPQSRLHWESPFLKVWAWISCSSPNLLEQPETELDELPQVSSPSMLCLWFTWAGWAMGRCAVGAVGW